MDFFDYNYVENALLEYQSLKNQLEQILDILENLEKQLSEELYWSGVGCDFVKQKYSSLLHNASDLRSAMTNLCAYVSGVIENHRLSEEKIASLFGGFS